MIVRRVLMIGATGMLGRPVARRLIDDGFAVRAMVRDIARAKALLPAACQLTRGDVRDDARLLDALEGCDAAYINLSEPMTRKPPAWDIEVEGTRAVIAACRAAGVERVLRLSAMGVDEAGVSWWAAKSKREADRVLMESDRAWTIFRPTWMMESLCTLKLAGPIMLCPDLLESPLRWLAGDDLGQQVAAALRGDAAIGRIYQPQGLKALTIRQALRRFAKAWPKQRLRIVRLPISALRAASHFNGQAHYLVSLLDMTRDHFARIDRQVIPSDLPAPMMTIEDYARYVERTGDWPAK